jgi:hypothetical protein
MRKVFGSKPKDLMSYYARLSWLALGLAWLGLRGSNRVMAVLSIPIVTLGSMAKIAGILSMRHLIPKIDAGEKVYLE